jgi:hypothetical protein
MPETLVINASPLIFLGNAGPLELLRASGAARFVVPPSVYPRKALLDLRAAGMWVSDAVIDQALRLAGLN